MALDAVGHGMRLDLRRPARNARHPKPAFPGGALLTAERRGAAVRPHYQLVAVIGRVDNDRFVGNTEIASQLVVSKLDEYDLVGATAIAVVMLLISFAMLLAINTLQHLAGRRLQGGL